ncbi:MAG: hypothetical protein R3E64_04195 [Halioglobus sp.]
MSTTLVSKTNAAQVCLADLQERGIAHLVESVFTSNKNPTPIIRLTKDPKVFYGGSIVRRGTTGRVMGVGYLGCQLRWEVAA